MAPRRRDGRGRHGAIRAAARSFAVHAPHEPRRRPAADTIGASASVHAEPDEPVGPVGATASPVAADSAVAPGVADGPDSAAVHPREAAPPAEVSPDSRTSRPRMSGQGPRSGATPAQLRRFIKSRPYVPLHELRRRFGLNGHEDDVVCIDLPDRRVWVGLPADEGRMLAELVRQGEVGCELSIDPASPVVVGVFPMRPVAVGRAVPAAPATPPPAPAVPPASPAEDQPGPLSAR